MSIFSICLIIVLITLAVCASLFYFYTAQCMIFFFRMLTKILYRPKHVGIENIPAEGPVLLVCNHVSLLDGFMLFFACPRPIRYIAHQEMIPRMFEPCVRETKLIKILPGNPKSIIQAVRAAREALRNGEVVGIMPEGGITRNGQMKAFEPGFMSMLKGVTTPDGKPVPVIPCYISGLYGSMFSYKYATRKQNIFLKPRRLDNDVIVSFGKPIYNPKTPQQVQLAVQELGVDTYREHNTKKLLIPARTLIRTCRKRKNKLMYADSSGTELSGYKFLTAVFVARKLLRQFVLGFRDAEPHVGVLAPMSVGGGLLNAALLLDRRVPVNLNFTFGAEGMNYCIEQAGIKHVLTSRKMLERLYERFPGLKLDAEIICAEDLLDKVSLWTKLRTLLGVIVLPNFVHDVMLKLRSKNLHEAVTTIIYTSGSTGKPKGVMLTNDNLAEVGRSTIACMRLNEKDVVLGFLPYFHAFGLMGNFWIPIFCGGAGVFHFNPLEPKKVGEMARKYSATFMASTATFLRTFLRRCPKEDFENLGTVMCGAEKLPVDLMDAWEEKYGHRPGEGYGATELSPMPSCNLIDSRTPDDFHIYRKDGSIGRASYRNTMKVIDLETGEDLPANEIGMIVVKGPIVMKGYYRQPDKTAEVIKNGWYTTGDVGKIDEDGFLWITGRESRISKIGGEMVPHILIEEEILKIVSESNDSESTEPPIAVTSLPHPTRGEQIIVLYRDAGVNPDKIVERMRASGLPLIWIPRVDGFIKVDSIPILGTGKLDLAAVKRKAAESRSNG